MRNVRSDFFVDEMPVDNIIYARLIIFYSVFLNLFEYFINFKKY